MDDLKKNEMDDCKDEEVTIQDLFAEYEGEPTAEKVTLFEPVGREKWSESMEQLENHSVALFFNAMTTNLKRFVVQ